MRQDPLLSPKLYIPPIRPALVSRPRLVERLNAGLHHKLTLISAPAGFGKTTVVTHWLKSAQCPSTWLSLDESDNDATRFRVYFVAALQAIKPWQEYAGNIGKGALSALQSPQPPPVEAVLTSLISEVAAIPDRIVLVLDDYHVIDAKPVDASTSVDGALTFLLEYLPPQMHLVTPPLHWEAGEEAIHILLDGRELRPGSDLQAIVTVSDLAALSALKALQARGVQVPGDLALTRFNDSAEGRLTSPPLTSVSMPFYEQGERAIEMLVMHLQGQPIPPQKVLSTRLVVRWSCGCPDQAMALADIQPVSPGKSVSPQASTALRRDATDAIARVIDATGETCSLLAQLVDALLIDVDPQAEGKANFLPTLERILRSSATGHSDGSVWQDVISVLRRYFLPELDSGLAAYLTRTIQAARLKGARTIVTGILEAVAVTIVDLGIDWSGIETLRDLRTGLREALLVSPQAMAETGR